MHLHVFVWLYVFVCVCWICNYLRCPPLSGAFFMLRGHSRVFCGRGPVFGPIVIKLGGPGHRQISDQNTVGPSVETNFKGVSIFVPPSPPGGFVPRMPRFSWLQNRPSKLQTYGESCYFCNIISISRSMLIDKIMTKILTKGFDC